MRGSVRIITTMILLFSLLSCTYEKEQVTILQIYVAASLGDVVTEISKEFEEQFNVKVNLNMASSGTLARQIENGAPANVFLSASKNWMDYAEDKLLVQSSTVINIASTSLVLIAPNNSEIKIPKLQDIVLCLNGRMSMGDPLHVPAGKYAFEALTQIGIADKLNNRLLSAKDVRTALMYVEMGECDLGIVYKTDALKSSKVQIVQEFPSDLHTPINYYGARVVACNPTMSNEYLRFLKNSNDTWKKFGFIISE